MSHSFTLKYIDFHYFLHGLYTKFHVPFDFSVIYGLIPKLIFSLQLNVGLDILGVTSLTIKNEIEIALFIVQ